MVLKGIRWFAPTLASLARECKGCLGTKWKGCHETEHLEAKGAHDEPTKKRAGYADHDVHEGAIALTLHDLASSPARDQTYDNPPKDMHERSPFCLRVTTVQCYSRSGAICSRPENREHFVTCGIIPRKDLNWPCRAEAALAPRRGRRRR